MNCFSALRLNFKAPALSWKNVSGGPDIKGTYKKCRKIKRKLRHVSRFEVIIINCHGVATSVNKNMTIQFLLIRVRGYIRFNLIGIGQAVGAVKHIHHGDDLSHCLIVQSEPLHGGTVGVDSVGTVVGDGYRQGDDLFGQRIKFSGFHDGF